MEKKNIFFAVAMIIGISLVAYGIFQSVPSIQTVGGFTTLSLTQTSMASSDPKLNGDVWILTVTPGGLGSYATSAVGLFPGKDIKTSDGTHAQNDVKIDINSYYNVCEYPILRDAGNPRVYNYYLKKYSGFPFPPSNDEVLNKCKTDGGSNSEIVTYGFQASDWSILDRGCVYRIGKAIPGSLPERPNVYTRTDVILTSGSKSYGASITNKDVNSAEFGDVAYARSGGSLKTYDECPQALQQGLKTIYDGSWRTIDGTSYDSYKNQFDYTDSNMLTIVTKSSTEILNTLNALNSKAFAVISAGKPLVYESGTGTKTIYGTSEGGIEDGRIYAQLDYSVLLPVITFYVKTDFLGIVTPIPKPQITYVLDPLTVPSATEGIALVAVKNIGDKGNIDVYLTCNSPASVGTATQTATFNSGQEYTFGFKVAGSGVLQRTQTSCTAFAKTSQETISKTFTVYVDPTQLCTPSLSSCDGNILKVCNQYGSDFTSSSDCSTQGKICGYNSNIQALDCLSTGTTTTTIPPDGERKLPNIFQWIILTISIAIFSLSIYLDRGGKL